MIYRNEIFVDDVSGHTIQAQWPLLDRLPVDQADMPAPRFFTIIAVDKPIPGTINGLHGEKRIDIPGANAHEAFANLPALFAQAKAEIEDELQKQLLLMPSGPAMRPGAMRDLEKQAASMIAGRRK